MELRSGSSVLAVALHDLHYFYRDYLVFHAFTVEARDVVAAAHHASAILIVEPSLQVTGEIRE